MKDKLACSRTYRINSPSKCNQQLRHAVNHISHFKDVLVDFGAKPSTHSPTGTYIYSELYRFAIWGFPSWRTFTTSQLRLFFFASHHLKLILKNSQNMVSHEIQRIKLS